MTESTAIQAIPVALWGGRDGEPVVFELRQVRIPGDWSAWRRLAWLEGQTTLWTELGHALDENGGRVRRGADQMADGLGELAWRLLAQLQATGETMPDDYLTTVHALVSHIAPAQECHGEARK